MAVEETMEEKEFRKPTAQELAILNKLLQADFPGAKELRLQLNDLVVRKIDEEGSLSLHVSATVFGEVFQRVPIEAHYSQQGSTDPFAPQVRFLVHVLGGVLNELEIYSDDGSPITRLPDASELVVDNPIAN